MLFFGELTYEYDKEPAYVAPEPIPAVQPRVLPPAVLICSFSSFEEDVDRIRGFSTHEQPDFYRFVKDALC